MRGSPTRGEDGAIQPALGGHVGPRRFDRAPGRAGHGSHCEVFDGDEVVGVDQAPGDQVEVVLTLVAHPAVDGGDSLDGATSSSRPPAVPGEGRLGRRQALPRLVEVSGVVDELTVTRGGEAGHTHVDADGPSRERAELGGNPDAEHHDSEPPARGLEEIGEGKNPHSPDYAEGL